jgi:hypothetical protein
MASKNFASNFLQENGKFLARMAEVTYMVNALEI